MLNGAGRTYSSTTAFGPWTSFDMPNSITDNASGNTSTFTYGPEHQRTKQARGDMTLYYADGIEIDIPSNGSMANATIKTYWPAGLGLDIDSNSSATTLQRWTHDDRLGSITAITNEAGTLTDTMPYDAWGNRRNLTNAPLTSPLRGYTGTDNKGFTGQEELDQQGLVHLNGRIYDPFVGRFLSADPEIQDPTHTQSYNRYTYVWNNPTNLTDPTGFEAAPIVTVVANYFEDAPPLDWPAALLRAATTSRLAMIGSRAAPVASAAYLGWQAGSWWYDKYGWKYLPSTGPSATELTNEGMKAQEAADEAEKEADSESLEGKSDEKKQGPRPNNGEAKPHGGDVHDQAIDNLVDQLKQDPEVENIRKNQAQVDADGNKVGNNRPDVQYDKNGSHYNVEYDNVPENSKRHGDVIRANDSKAVTELIILKK